MRKTRLMLLFLTIVLSNQFADWHIRYGYEEVTATPAMLAAGTAATPFQYRALIPWIAGTLHRTFGFDLQLVYFKLETLFLIIAVLAFNSFLGLFFEETGLLSLGLFYALPFMFISAPFYPADIPSLALFTLGLILIYKRQWRWYYPLFILATFNRETTLLLTLICVLNRGYGHAALQVILWLMVKAMLAHWYADNPGSLAEFQLPLNLYRLLIPSVLIALLSTWGGLWLPVLLRFKRLESEFLRKSLWVVVPALLIYFVVGVVHELRIYLELTPLVLTAFLLTARSSDRRS